MDYDCPVNIIFLGKKRENTAVSVYTCIMCSSTSHFQVTFINPVIERRSKLQRQRRIFPKEKGCLFIFFLIHAALQVFTQVLSAGQSKLS